MIILYALCVLLAVVLLYLLFLLVLALLVNPHREYETNNRIYRNVLNFSTAVALKLVRIHVHTAGIEKIPSDTKLLFVSNHRSNFDPIITWYVFRRWEPAFISKESNFSIPIFGRLIRKCCFMAIDRENPRNAARTIRKAAALIRSDEVSIGVYPEGTRSKSGKLLPFHNGVFKIAQQAEVPIVVLSITGTERIHKNYPFRRSDVHLNVLEVLKAEEIKGKRANEIGNHVRELIGRQFHEKAEGEKK